MEADRLKEPEETKKKFAQKARMVERRLESIEEQVRIKKAETEENVRKKRESIDRGVRPTGKKFSL